MKVENFKKQVWIGIGFVLGSIVVFGAIFFVLSGIIGSQADSIMSGRANIANQSALINSYSDLKANAPTATAYEAAMNKILASQDNLIAFPSQIDGIAHNDNVADTFSFQGDPVPARATAPGYIAFKLNLTGSLSALLVFFKDMESAPILLSSIDSFDLAQSGPSYTVSATGRVFFK